MRKIIIVALTGLLLFGSVIGVAQELQSSIELSNDIQPMPTGNGIMQRIRNQICDTLGICPGCDNLTTLTGILRFDGTYFYINDVELHFGPNWYIVGAESSIDFDGDGQFELIYYELQGLVGSEITVEGHLQSNGWMSVFTINGEIYREVGEPIWATQHQWRGRHRNGPNKP